MNNYLKKNMIKNIINKYIFLFSLLNYNFFFIYFGYITINKNPNLMYKIKFNYIVIRFILKNKDIIMAYLIYKLNIFFLFYY
jgi:hypothetical protein